MGISAARLGSALAGLFLGLANVLFAGFSGSEVFLPSVGRVSGFGGSEFYTTVWITNLSTTTPANFQFQFLRTGQANTAPLAFSDTLAPGQTKIYENVVETRFGLTSANGAARIIASGGAELYVSSRIFEQPPGTDLGNSKGLFFSGVPASFGLSVGEGAVLQGVNQGGAQNLRYNFILLEVGGQAASVRVGVKDAAGTVLAIKTYNLTAYEHRQLNVTDILPSIATTNALLQASVLSGAGKVLFAGAQVTNVSQDPTGFEMSFKESLLATNGNGNVVGGVTSLNNLTGNVTLVPGNNVTITPLGNNTLTIAATASSAGVSSLNTLTGNVTLEAGNDISITRLGNSLRIAHANGAVPQTGWSLTGNNVIPGQFLGTTNAQPLDFRVNNQRAFRLEPNAISPNVIGGHSGNRVTAGVNSATVGGGGGLEGLNQVTGNFGTVSGGAGNQAAEGGSVGGGVENTAGGDYSTIAGGIGNVTSFRSSIGGGENNTASGGAAAVPGGSSNVAAGNYSFAAGRRAKALHDGAFVWGDGTAADIASSAANQFFVRASGGARFFSNAAATAGVSLAAGAGSWSSLSDRRVKDNVRPVDGRDALERLLKVPIASWNYRSQDASIRHIGPMAQDFHAAFGLGEDEKHISTVDADGVALAAIQALYELNREKDRQIEELKRRLEALENP